MEELPQHIKRQLRGLAGRAHQRELERLLAELAAKFDAWRAGQLDADRLVRWIHQYDRGPLREVYTKYSNVSEQALVAHAVVTGLLTEGEVPEEVSACIQGPLQFYRRMAEDTGEEKRS